MIDVNDLRKGVTFDHDDQLWKVLEYSHNKPGRGNATIRVKVRNLRTGVTMEKTFQSGDRVQDVRLDYHNVQYLYRDGELFYFMDTETFDQPALSREALGGADSFLKDGQAVKLTLYDGEPLDLELPAAVELEVTESEFGLRGDTANSPTKLATLETGLQVQVPLFVNVGDTIRVDTATGRYLTRVN